jgi:GNAT superfamily N-acetyltransferase
VTVPFPEHHTLSDGTRVMLRPIQPSDRDELRRGFESLSSESRYRRFFAAVSRLDDRMLDYLTNVDGVNHFAVVAFTQSLDLKEERGVGVARFIRVKGEPTVAEVAVTVTDDMQHKGLGTLLLITTIREARAHGITHFRGETLATNEPIRSLLEASGAITKPTPDGTIVFDLEIPADPKSSPLLFRLLGIAAREVSAFLRKLTPAS